jgi:hypothetical protein
LVTIFACACSGASASDDDDDGGSAGETAGSGKGGTGGSTGGGSVGGTGGGSVGGTGGGGVGGAGGVGPSGLPSGAYLDELTSDELHALCVWGIPLQGGPGQKQCSDSVTVTTHTVEECSVDMVTIHCTVGSLEACLLSLNGDPCLLLDSAACAAYIACATGS